MPISRTAILTTNWMRQTSRTSIVLMVRRLRWLALRRDVDRVDRVVGLAASVVLVDVVAAAAVVRAGQVVRVVALHVETGIDRLLQLLLFRPRVALMRGPLVWVEGW